MFPAADLRPTSVLAFWRLDGRFTAQTPSPDLAHLIKARCRGHRITFPHSLVARIERSHRSDPGSIPGGGDIFAHFYYR